MSFLSRLVPWLCVFWLIGVTVRFCSTTIKTLANPFNPGDDWVWFVGWIGVVLVWMLAYVLFHERPPFVTYTSVLLCVAAAVVLLFLSHTVVPFLIASWIVLDCAALGSVTLKLFVGGKQNALEQVACAIPLGFTWLTLLTFVFGISHILTTPSMWILLITTTALVRSSLLEFLSAIGTMLRKYFATEPKEILRESGVLAAVIGSYALANFTWAIAPEIQFDGLNYHLAIPKAYLQHGGVFEIEFFHAYFVRSVEMFLTFCIALGGSQTAKLWIFLMGLCSGICVFALGKALFGTRVGYWAAALFLTTPLVGWLSGTAYIDNILTLLVTSAFFAIVQWHEKRTDRWLYVAAVLAGIAIGSKLNAAFAFIVIGPVVLWQVSLHPFQSARAKLKFFLTAALLFAITATPTYILIYSFTGNPVFPLLNGIFKSPKWAFDNTIMNASQFGLDTSFISLIRFPFRLTLDTSRFGEALPRGGLGVSLLLAFPFAASLLSQRRNIVSCFLLGAVGYLLLLFQTMQYGRYYIPILPVVAILGVATLFHLSNKRIISVLRICLLVVVITQPLVSSVQFWNIPERFPMSVALGTESREAFLGRALPGYRSAMHLNMASAGRERILGVGTENLRFYLLPSLETFPLSLQGNGIRKLSDMPPDGELVREIKKLGFNRLFTTRTAAAHPERWFPYLQGEFLETHASLEFADQETLVYRFR